MGDSILFPPTLSSSSMNITQGALALASPTKINTAHAYKSDTAHLKYNKYINSIINGTKEALGGEGSMQVRLWPLEGVVMFLSDRNIHFTPLLKIWIYIEIYLKSPQKVSNISGVNVFVQTVVVWATCAYKSTEAWRTDEGRFDDYD